MSCVPIAPSKIKTRSRAGCRYSDTIRFAISPDLASCPIIHARTREGGESFGLAVVERSQPPQRGDRSRVRARATRRRALSIRSRYPCARSATRMYAFGAGLRGDPALARAIMSAVSIWPVPATYSGWAIIASRTMRNARASSSARRRRATRTARKSAPRCAGSSHKPEFRSRPSRSRHARSIVVGKTRAELENSPLRRDSRTRGTSIGSAPIATQSARIPACFTGAVIVERGRGHRRPRHRSRRCVVVRRMRAALQRGWIHPNLAQDRRTAST